MLLLVLAAAGVAGVLYWRQSLKPPGPPVAAAGEPAKHGKERRRRRRGVRRLARNEVFVASGSPGEAPVDEGTSPTYAPPPREDPNPIAPGSSSLTEAPPTDVFGPLSSPTAAPTSGRRQPVDEPEPIKCEEVARHGK